MAGFGVRVKFILHVFWAADSHRSSGTGLVLEDQGALGVQEDPRLALADPATKTKSIHHP